MNTQKIKQLITRYENGETSREEELYLQSVFSESKDIPYELRHYSAIFGYFTNAGKNKITNPDFDSQLFEKLEAIEDKAKKPISIKRNLIYISIAASLAILIGIYFSGLFGTQATDTYDDPRLAYAETKRVLLEISGNLNTGLTELNHMQELNTGLNKLNALGRFDDGLTNFKKISVMDKSQKTITHKNK